MIETPFDNNKGMTDWDVAEIQGEIAGDKKKFTNYDPIGLPDTKDVENIKAMIRNHELAKPGEIGAFVREAKAIKDNNLNKFGSTADKSLRRVLTMPTGLLRMIEESYPLMFTNKKHLAWFVKNFPMFSTHDVY